LKRAIARTMMLLEMAADDRYCDQYGKDHLIAAAHNILQSSMHLLPILPGDELILQLSDPTIALLQRIDHDAEVGMAVEERVVTLGQDYAARMH
jgi:hypothetical protein